MGFLSVICDLTTTLYKEGNKNIANAISFAVLKLQRKIILKWMKQSEFGFYKRQDVFDVAS